MIKKRWLLQLSMDLPGDERSKRIRGERSARSPFGIANLYIILRDAESHRPPASRLHQNVIRKFACNVRADETMPD